MILHLYLYIFMKIEILQMASKYMNSLSGKICDSETSDPNPEKQVWAHPLPEITDLFDRNQEM